VIYRMSKKNGGGGGSYTEKYLIYIRNNLAIQLLKFQILFMSLSMVTHVPPAEGGLRFVAHGIEICYTVSA
jgi:hypothetical protein